LKKKELKNNQKKNYWGNFILIFLLFLVIKFGIQNDWFVKKTNNDLKLDKFDKDMCKKFSLTKSECELYEKNGINPRLKEIIEKAIKEKSENETKSIITDGIPRKN